MYRRLQTISQSIHTLCDRLDELKVELSRTAEAGWDPIERKIEAIRAELEKNWAEL